MLALQAASWQVCAITTVTALGQVHHAGLCLCQVNDAMPLRLCLPVGRFDAPVGAVGNRPSMRGNAAPAACVLGNASRRPNWKTVLGRRGTFHCGGSTCSMQFENLSSADEDLLVGRSLMQTP